MAKSLTLGKAILWMLGDTKGLDKSLREARKNVDKVLNGVGKGLQSIGDFGQKLGVGMTAAGAAITGALGYVVSQASEAEAAEARLNAVLQSTGGVAGVSADQAMKLASSLQSVSTFGDEAILDAESLILGFTQIGKDVFPRVTEMALDMSTALGQDLSSSAQTLGRMLANPERGMRLLARQGVVLSAEQQGLITALVGTNKELQTLGKEADRASQSIPKLSSDLQVAQQKLREMQASGKASQSALMAQSNKVKELSDKLAAARDTVTQFRVAQQNSNSTMSESEKLQKAQTILLDALGKKYGGQARAAAQTFAGQLAQVKNQLGDMAEIIGKPVMNVLRDLLTQVRPIIDKWAEWLSNQDDLTGKVKKFVNDALAQLIPILKKLWTGALKPLVLKIKEWNEGQSDLLPKLLTLALILGPLMVVLGPIVIALSSIVTALGSLVLAIGPTLTFITALGSLVKFVGAIMTSTFGLVLVAITAIIVAFTAFAEMWKSGDWTHNWITDLVDKYFPKLGQGIDWVFDKIVAGWEWLWEFLKSVPGKIKAALKPVANVILWPFREGANMIILALNWMIEQINQIDIEVPDWVPKLGGKSLGFNLPSLSEIPPFAAGGVMSKSGLALVGERGPEIVSLPGGARVYDSAASRSMAGGVSVSVKMDGLVVREEADISKLAHALAREAERKLLAGGRRLAVA